MEGEIRRASWKDRVLYAMGRREVYLVNGDSMTPTLKSGDVVLVAPSPIIGVGDIVLARHPYRASVVILKRVAGISGDGRLHLLGDNPAESTDSRTFGEVSLELIVGRIECRLK